jgi:hypothetical protein
MKAFIKLSLAYAELERVTKYYMNDDIKDLPDSDQVPDDAVS